jgi:aquaporin Z
MSPKALLAELIGTFGLTLAVLISIQNPSFPVPTPVIAGLTLGAFVYTIGSISGCHINPAVTIGLLAIGKVDLAKAAGYVVAQFVGAGIALALGKVMFAAPAAVVASGSAGTGLAELLGAALFVFGIAAVVLGRVPAPMSGLVIGTSLLLGVHFAAHGSNGVLNPAVALGIGSFSAPYVWGPVVGGAVGAFLSSRLS